MWERHILRRVPIGSEGTFKAYKGQKTRFFMDLKTTKKHNGSLKNKRKTCKLKTGILHLTRFLKLYPITLFINAGLYHTLHQFIFNLQQDNMSEDEYDTMSDISASSDNNNAM